MEEKILKVLEKVNEDIVSYDGDNLFDSGILDSFQVIDIVSELEDSFDIEINVEYVTEENFKTKETIIELMKKVMEE